MITGAEWTQPAPRPHPGDSMTMYAFIAALEIVPAFLIFTYHRAASGRLVRNHFFGIRIPSTLASDAAWRAGHRAAIPIVWLTVPAVFGGVVALARTDRASLELAFWSTTAMLLLIVFIAVVVAHKAARRPAEAKRAGESIQIAQSCRTVRSRTHVGGGAGGMWPWVGKR
jgi:uncharacterized membrane protein